MTGDRWIRMYEGRGALWLHSGNPAQPHALLSKGGHSDGFFNSGLVAQEPMLLDNACFELMGRLTEHGLKLDEVDRVIGPAMGAITLAHDLARNIGRERCRFCLCGYTQKVKEVDGTEKMVLDRIELEPGEWVLTVEDVLTSGRSVGMTTDAIVAGGGQLLPFVAVLVNRSGLTEVGGRKIVALIERKMNNWDADECPLCRQGSSAIRPKGKENWARLTAVY